MGRTSSRSMLFPVTPFHSLKASDGACFAVGSPGGTAKALPQGLKQDRSSLGFCTQVCVGQVVLLSSVSQPIECGFHPHGLFMVTMCYCRSSHHVPVLGSRTEEEARQKCISAECAF
jgi:hypothetical protein